MRFCKTVSLEKEVVRRKRERTIERRLQAAASNASGFFFKQ
jgi:hypothetical protein